MIPYSLVLERKSKDTLEEQMVELHSRSGSTQHVDKISETVRVVENSWYQLFLECPSDEPLIDRVILMLNDEEIGTFSSSSVEYIDNSIKIPIEWRKRREQWEERGEDSNFRQIFLLQYDVAYLSIGVMKGDDIQEYDTDYLLCVSRNQDEYESVQTMIEQIMDFPDEKVNKWVFQVPEEESLLDSIMNGGYQKNSSKSLTSYCELIGEIYRVFRKNLSMFRSRSKCDLIQKDCVMPYQNTRQFSTNEFNLLIKNLDQLNPVHHGTAIQHNGRNYLPQRIQSAQLVQNSDVYENRVILGFLKMIVNKLKLIRQSYRTELKNEQSLLIRLKKLEGKWGKAPILIIKRYQLQRGEKLIGRLEELLKLCQELHYSYKLLLNCNEEIITSIPRKTKIFQTIRHYSDIYDLIIKWFRYGDFSLNKETLFLRIKKLDKLYEYYCTLHLLKMLKDQGFNPKESPQSIQSYSYEDAPLYTPEKSIPNTYELQNERYEITFYYQPVIYGWNSKTRNGISLYKTQKGILTPDFLFKIMSIDHLVETYAIMDAKFSTRNTIKIYSWDKMLKKYVLIIASENEFYPAVSFMWLLQGRVDDSTKYLPFYNSPLAKKHKPIPSYGIYTLNGTEYYSQELWAELERCLFWLIK